MATFTPLNAASEDLDKEKRTLEIRIEEAVQIYQNALSAQKQGDDNAATKYYDELLNVRILRELPFTVNSNYKKNNALLLLHYLTRKNHGLFLLSKLQSLLSSDPSTDPIPVYRDALLDFAIALACDYNDIELWSFVAELAEKLEMPRIQRFALESSFYTGYEPFDAERVFTNIDDLNPGKLISLQNLYNLLKKLGGIAEPLPQLDLSISSLYTLPSFFPQLPTPSFHRRSINLCPKIKKLQLSHDTLHGFLDLVLYALQINEKKPPTRGFPSTLIIHVHSLNLSTAESHDLESTDSELWSEISDAGPDTNTINTAAKLSEPVYAKDIVPPPSDNLPKPQLLKRPIDDSDVRISKRSRGRDLRTPSESNLFSLIASITSDINEQIQKRFPDATSPFSGESMFREYSSIFEDYHQLLVNFPSEGSIPDLDVSTDSAANGAFSKMILIDLAMHSANRLEHMQVPDGYLLQLLSEVNSLNMVPAELATFFVESMLRPRKSEPPFYLQQCWGKIFKKKFTTICERVESTLHELVKASLQTPEVFNISQSLFELFLDDYFLALKFSSNDQKDDNVSEIPTESLEYKKLRCLRWKSLTEQVVELQPSCKSSSQRHLIIRNSWARNLLLRLTGCSSEAIVENFKQLRCLLQENSDSLELLNSQCMADLSVQVVDFELSKLQTVEFFNTLFMNTKNLDFNAVIKNLEPVLSPENKFAEDPQAKFISQFLEKTSTEFQIHLWYLLYQAYSSAHRPYNSLLCAFQSLKIILIRLCSSSFSIQDAGRRQAELLGMLNFSSNLFRIIWQKLHEQPDILSPCNEMTVIDCIRIILIYLRTFAIYVGIDEDISDQRIPKPSNPEFDSYAQTVKDSLMSGWCIFYTLFAHLLHYDFIKADAQKLLPQILTAIHSQYSFRGYCSSSNQSFLELSQTECQRLDAWENENEILQCVCCRFNLIIGSEYYVPQSHQSDSVNLTSNDAIKIIPFILGFAVKRSHGWVMPRSDQKNALEIICKVIRFPGENNADVYFNKCAIKEFLERDISPQLTKMLLKSNDILGLREIGSKVVDDRVRGLYYAQSQVLFGYYRSRLKGSRCINDLLVIIKYFLLDLYLNPRRQDSWYTCSSVFSSLADEELGWSAEQICLADDVINEYRRKAILCNLMALSLPFTQDKLFKANVYFDFAMNLYASARPPLEMAAFLPSETRVFSGASGLYNLSMKPIEVSKVIALAADYFGMSAELSNDWRALYMLGKACRKCGDMENALVHFEAAAALAPTKSGSGSQQALLIEPHYALLSNLSKAAIEGSVEIVQILSYLRRIRHPPKDSGSLLEVKNEDINIYKRNALLFILKALAEMRILDKQSWHHRPTYRIAKIMEHLGNVQQAKEEMETLFSYKTSGKSLLNIWRTPNERPGRHFYYGATYSRYLLSLFYKTNDKVNFLQFLKRFRRSSSTIYEHRQIWLDIMIKYLEDLRLQHSVKETQINDLPLVEFKYVYKEISLLDEQKLSLLHQVYEIRKLNNGLYPTIKVDDFLIDCFMSLYNEVKSSISPLDANIPNSPSTITAKPLNDEKAINNENSVKQKTIITRKDVVSKVLALFRPHRETYYRETQNKILQKLASTSSSLVRSFTEDSSQAGESPGTHEEIQ